MSLAESDTQALALAQTINEASAIANLMLDQTNEYSLAELGTEN